MQLFFPMVPALCPKMATSCSDVTFPRLSSAANPTISSLVSSSILFLDNFELLMIVAKTGRNLSILESRYLMVLVLIYSNLFEFPINKNIKI